LCYFVNHKRAVGALATAIFYCGTFMFGVENNVIADELTDTNNSVLGLAERHLASPAIY
jgi:hypothetical protein